MDCLDGCARPVKPAGVVCDGYRVIFVSGQALNAGVLVWGSPPKGPCPLIVDTRCVPTLQTAPIGVVRSDVRER